MNFSSSNDTSEEEFDRHLAELRSKFVTCKRKAKTNRNEQASHSCNALKHIERRENGFTHSKPTRATRFAQTECKRVTAPTAKLRGPQIRWQDLFDSSDSEEETDSNERRAKETHKENACSTPFHRTEASFEGFKDRDDADHFLRSLSERPLADGSNCHPRAFRAVRNFRAHKTDLVADLFDIFNGFVFSRKLPSDIRISWSRRMTATAGFCRCTRDRETGLRTCSVELSAVLLTTADRVRDTLVHELCHAATWIVSEEPEGHGSFWSAWARGANLMFKSLPLITRCHKYK